MTTTDFPYLGYGVGLRATHYRHILETQPEIDWFEIISENYMDSKGWPRHVIRQIAERYPVVMHGVSMSIGSTDALNMEYLKRLKTFAKSINARWISDHLCWTGVLGKNTHDLLPVPLTQESLNHVVERIKVVQEVIERPLVLENPSSYLQYTADTMQECDFIREMANASGCKLLLDINNVYVSAFNHHFDALAYIKALPLDKVVQFHLAGHSHQGSHIVDTHDNHVVEGVWELYRATIALTGKVSTLLEWDAHIPDFDTLRAEVLKAKSIFEGKAISAVPQTQHASATVSNSLHVTPITYSE